MRMSMPAIGSCERHKPGSEDIECRQTGRDDADPIHPRGMVVGGGQDFIFTPESGQRRDTANRQAAYEQRGRGYRQLSKEPAHVPQILFAAQGVNQATGSKEEQSFEE